MWKAPMVESVVKIRCFFIQLACGTREPIVCLFQDFERKSALFSLASSEILIINLWEHQIGLYQGANMGLLKTVFEVNLGLFGKRSQDG
jgi:Root hair defective 3 GTP-binding protein (RHD3)